MKADTKDRINRCIAIERKILDKTSSGILGASSEEEFIPSSSSSLSGDEVSKEESKEEEVPGTEIQPNNFASFLQPPALPPFTDEKTHSKMNLQKTMLQISMLPTMTSTLIPSPMDKSMILMLR